MSAQGEPPGGADGAPVDGVGDSVGGGVADGVAAGDGLPGARRGKPTLKTIALATGLAVPTVSRALAGARDISPATKDLVRRVAGEMGYVPNRAGVRLRTGRTNVVALVLSTEHDMMNHTARLISSLAGSLRGTPFHLVVTPFFAGEDPMRPIRYVVETGAADAVVFNQTEPRDPRVAWLMERRFPFATHGRTDWAERHAWADFDNATFAAVAVRALARRGRRRVLLVAPPRDQNYARDFLRGGMGAGAALGLRVEALDGAHSDDPAGAVEAAVAAALGGARLDGPRFDKPAFHGPAFDGPAFDGPAFDGPAFDGIVCASTAAAMATVAALEERGLSLGGAVDLFAKEAIPFLRLFRPGILAVREDVGRAGAMLARAAIRAIREPDAPPVQDLEVPQEWEDTA